MLGELSAGGLLLLLFVGKMLATSLSLGSGSSGGIFSPSLFMGATIGGAFAAALAALHLPLPINIPSFAMVGMGAMVGGGTGAVMTAVAMIFEMTRDYDIVMPMIMAVAMSVGVRRLLMRENIYSMKLFRRGQPIPKALHANMFLVRRAKEVMDQDFAVVPASMSFDAFLADPDNRGRSVTSWSPRAIASSACFASTPRSGARLRPRKRARAWMRSRCAASRSCVRTT